MQFEHEFYKLPFSYDVARLLEEVNGFSEEEWTDRGEQAYKGNNAIHFVSTNGEINESFIGPMKTTESLKRCPYMAQIIASFDQVIGRSRLMRIAPGEQVPPHRDTNYHWYNRGRLHVPVITNDKVRFICEDIEVNMAAGESWIFDNWRKHQVINESDEHRVHLVIDFAPSGKFWNIMDRSAKPGYPGEDGDAPHHLNYEDGKEVQILCEKYCIPDVMSPGEIDGIIKDFCAQMRNVSQNNEEDIKRFEKRVSLFTSNWRRVWYLHGDDQSAFDKYHGMRSKTAKDLKKMNISLVLPNNANVISVFSRVVLANVMNPELVKKKLGVIWRN